VLALAGGGAGAQEPGFREEPSQAGNSGTNTLAEDEHVCRADSFVREGVPLRAGVVRVESGDPRPFLLADEGTCPVDRGRPCQIGSPLPVGEAVIVSHSFRQFVCTARTSDGGVRSVGWLPRRSVRTAEVDQDPPIEAWPGDWVGGGGMLTIRAGVGPDLLEVEGTALAGEGARTDAAAWVNGSSKPQGQALAVADEFGSGCRVDLRLVGSLLFATEAGACGSSARFDGVYTRRDAP
jgi:hypothetical protein